MNKKKEQLLIDSINEIAAELARQNNILCDIIEKVRHLERDEATDYYQRIMREAIEPSTAYDERK